MNFDSYIVSDTKIAKSILLGEITNFNNKRFNFKVLKQKAFTLAEVLITLSIIGVVAAMTVPTLMSNTSNQQHVTALKKAYSTLSNAIKMMPVNLGCGSDYQCMMSAIPPYTAGGVHGGSWNAQGLAFMYALSSQFKTAKFAEYTCDNTGHLGCLNFGHFTTQDGMVFGLHYIDIWASSTGIANVVVDTNGFEKGPNVYGKDQHWLYIPFEEYNGVPAGSIVAAGSSQYAQMWNSPNYYWKKINFKQSRWNDFYYTGKILETGKIDESDFKSY